MAKNELIFLTQKGKLESGNVSTGVAQIFYTAPTEGAKILMLSAASISGTPTSLQIYVDNGGGDLEVGRYLPATAVGENIFLTALPNLPKDKNGNPYINLESGSTLKGKVASGSVLISIYSEEY